MKTTTEWLQGHNYCPPSHGWWRRNKSRLTTDLDVVNALVGDGHLEWANWLLVRLLDDDKRTEYAIFAAEQVLPIYEKWGDSDAPRRAIEAAKAGEPTAANAAAAVEAAWASAWDAYAAANTAANAANAAAYAANAANADHAAYAAAYAANAANADAATLKAIVGHGVTLLTEVNE